MTEQDLKFLNELCSWLNHQKGMMCQDYAKQLAKLITRIKNDTNNT